MQMTEQMKQFFYGKNFTLKGRIFYPDLLTPKPNDKGVLKYGVMFAWPINDPSQAQMINTVKQAIAQAKQTFFAHIPDLHFGNPIKQWGVYQKRNGKANPEFLNGCEWVNASATEKVPPQVVDQHKQEVFNAAEVYSGRNALMNFHLYPYENNGNVGLAIGVSAVMLLEGGEREVGGGVNLDEAFGQFASDMGAGQQAPTQQAPAHQVMQQGMNTQQQYQAPAQQQYQAPAQQQYQPQQQPAQQQYDPNAGQAQWTPGQPLNNQFNN